MSGVERFMATARLTWIIFFHREYSVKTVGFPWKSYTSWVYMPTCSDKFCQPLTTPNNPSILTKNYTWFKVVQTKTKDAIVHHCLPVEYLRKIMFGFDFLWGLCEGNNGSGFVERNLGVNACMAGVPWHVAGSCRQNHGAFYRLCPLFHSVHLPRYWGRFWDFCIVNSQTLIFSSELDSLGFFFMKALGLFSGFPL